MSVAPWFAPRSRRSAWWATRSSSSVSSVPQRGQRGQGVGQLGVRSGTSSRAPARWSRSAWNRATAAATGCASGSPNTVAIQGILASSTDSPGPRTGLCPACGQVFFDCFWSARCRGLDKLDQPEGSTSGGGPRRPSHRLAPAGSGQRPRAVPLPVVAPFDPALSTTARSGLGARAGAPVRPPLGHPQLDGWNPRSRRLLPTTNTELSAIAAPAIIGDSSPEAARGSAATL